MYPVIEVPADASDLTETLGTKPKFWYRSSSGADWLFKEARQNTGEDWSEKVSCEVCALLGIPHAHYDLASHCGRRGVVSPNIVPQGGRLVLGNELLAKTFQDYPEEQRFGVRQYTLSATLAVVSSDDVRVANGFHEGNLELSAADVFVGYLILDALVGNQDRHHENWGLILLPAKEVVLAPTFDHASSLGRNEPEQKRIERLNTRDKGRSVEKYAERARSAFYARNRRERLSTVAAFEEAARFAPQGGSYWRQRLEAVDKAEFETIFDQVPPEVISDPARDFALRLLFHNRQRLLCTKGLNS